MSEKVRIDRLRVYFAAGSLLTGAGFAGLMVAILGPVGHDFQMAMVVASMLVAGLGLGLLLGVLIKMVRQRQRRLNGTLKLERKVRARLALGPSVIAMGTSFQVLSFAAHNPVAKLIIMGASIFVMIIGIAIAVTGIAEARRAAGKSK